MLLSWIISLLLLATVTGKDVCYRPLGCFSDEQPWTGILQRPLKLFPWPPKDIDTRFLLFTNENPNNFQRVSPTDLATIEASNFRLDRITRFIIHGLIDKGEESWLLDMCKKMFKVEEVNCICVDWKRGARTQYAQAVHNIRVVGAEIAFLIQGLSTEMGYSLENVHLIGHSLGAHAAAEAGRRLGGLVGRITGLDPADPCFQGTPEEVRLDSSDAMFVDVIHTDSAPIVPSLGFGMSQKVGHLDFYPNGGKQMPGCQKNILSTIVDVNGLWEGTRDFVACNHLRSYKYYASSILSPSGFLGYPCASYKEFQESNCFPCPVGGCPQMGHYADHFQGKTSAVGQTFFLKQERVVTSLGHVGRAAHRPPSSTHMWLDWQETVMNRNTYIPKSLTPTRNPNSGGPSFTEAWRYRVSVTLAGEKKVSGYIRIALYGSNGNSKQYEIFKGSLKPDASHTRDIDVNLNVGKIQKVKFLWNNHVINLFRPKLGASQITVQCGEDGIEYHFCSGDTVKEDVLQSLYPC